MTQATLGFLGFDYGLNTSSEARWDAQVARLTSRVTGKPLVVTVTANIVSAARAIGLLSKPVNKTITVSVDPASLSTARAQLRGLTSRGTINLKFSSAALGTVTALTSGLGTLNATLTTLDATLSTLSGRLTTTSTGLRTVTSSTNSYAQQVRTLAAEEKAGIITRAEQIRQLGLLQTSVQGEMSALRSLGVMTVQQQQEFEALRLTTANLTSTLNSLMVAESTEVQSANAQIQKARELNQQRQAGTIKTREFISSMKQLRTEMQAEAQALATLSTRTAAQQKQYELLTTAIRNVTAQINTASGANLRAANSGRMLAASIGSGLAGSLTMVLGPGGMVISMLLSLTAGLTGANVATKALVGVAGGLFLGVAAAASLGIKQNTELTKSYNVLKANGVDDIRAVDESLTQLRNTGGLVMQSFGKAEMAKTIADLVRAGAAGKAAQIELATGAKLASAEEGDLSETTLKLHRNLTQFGLGAESAARSGDMLAKASNMAFTNAAGLSTGLNVVGATAKLAGFDFAETLGALVELDNKGFDAADMGATGLRGSISALADPSIKAQGLLNGMQVSLKNTDGTARKTRDIMKDLRDWIVKQGITVNQNTKDLEGNSEALSKVSGIMDTRAAAAMMMLTDQWDKNTASIRDGNGFLDQTADIMSRGLGPAWQRMTKNMREFGGELTSSTMGGLSDLVDWVGKGVLIAGQFVHAWNLVNEAVGKGKSWEDASARFPQFARGLNLIHDAQEGVKTGVTWLNDKMPILKGVVEGLTIAIGLNYIAGGGLATLYTTRLLPGVLSLVTGFGNAGRAMLAFAATPVGGLAILAGAVTALAMTVINLRSEIEDTYAAIGKSDELADNQLQARIDRLRTHTDALSQAQAKALQTNLELGKAQRGTVTGVDIWGNQTTSYDQNRIKTLEAQAEQQRSHVAELVKRPENQPEVRANAEAKRLLDDQLRLNNELKKAQASSDTARATRLNVQLSTLQERIESFRAENKLQAAALKALEEVPAAPSASGGKPTSGPLTYAQQQQKLYTQASDAARKLLAEQVRLEKEIRAAQLKVNTAQVHALQVTLGQLKGQISDFKSASAVNKQAMGALTATGEGRTTKPRVALTNTDKDKIANAQWARDLKTTELATLKAMLAQEALNGSYDRWRAIQHELDARAGRDKTAAARRQRELAQEAEQVKNLERNTAQLLRSFSGKVAGGTVTSDGLNSFTSQIEDLNAKLADLPTSSRAAFAGLLKQAGQLQGQAKAILEHKTALAAFKKELAGWGVGQVQAALDVTSEKTTRDLLLARLKQAKAQELSNLRGGLTTMSESDLKAALGRLNGKQDPQSLAKIKILTTALSTAIAADLAALRTTVATATEGDLTAALKRVGTGTDATSVSKRKIIQAQLDRLRTKELSNLRSVTENTGDGALDEGSLRTALARAGKDQAKRRIIQAALDRLRTQQLSDLRSAVQATGDEALNEGQLKALLTRAGGDQQKVRIIQEGLRTLRASQLNTLRDTTADMSLSDLTKLWQQYKSRPPSDDQRNIVKTAYNRAVASDLNQFRDFVQRDGVSMDQLQKLIPTLKGDKLEAAKTVLAKLQTQALGNLRTWAAGSEDDPRTEAQLQAALLRSKGDPKKTHIIQTALDRLHAQQLSELRAQVEGSGDDALNESQLSDLLVQVKGNAQKTKIVQAAIKRLHDQQLSDLRTQVEGSGDDALNEGQLNDILAQVKGDPSKTKIVQAAIKRLHDQQLAQLRDDVQSMTMAELQDTISKSVDPDRLKVLNSQLEALEKVQNDVLRGVATTAAELSRQAAQATVSSYEDRKAAAGENLKAIWALEVETGSKIVSALNAQALLEKEARDQQISDNAQGLRDRAGNLPASVTTQINTSEKNALDASQTQYDNDRSKNRQMVNAREVAARVAFFRSIRTVEVDARRDLLQFSIDTLQEQSSRLEQGLQDQLAVEGLSAQQRLALWQKNKAALIENKRQELLAISRLARNEENLRWSQATQAATDNGTIDSATAVKKEGGGVYTVRELLFQTHTAKMNAIGLTATNGMARYVHDFGVNLTKAQSDVMTDRVKTVQNEVDTLFAQVDEGDGRVRSQLRGKLEQWASEFKNAGIAGSAGVDMVQNALDRLSKADVSAAKGIETLLDPKKFADYKAQREEALAKLQGKDTLAGTRAAATSPFESETSDVQSQLDKLDSWWMGLGATGQKAQRAFYVSANAWLQTQLGKIKSDAAQAGTEAGDAFTRATDLRLKQAAGKQGEADFKTTFASGGGDVGTVGTRLAQLQAERDAAKKLLDEEVRLGNQGNQSWKDANDAYLASEETMNGDLFTVLDQRQKLHMQSVESQRKLDALRGTGNYQGYITELRADQNYYKAKLAFAQTHYGAQHTLTLAAQADLDESNQHLEEATQDPIKALGEVRRAIDELEGKKSGKKPMFADEIENLGVLAKKFPQYKSDLDAIISRYLKLRSIGGLQDMVAGVQKWTGVVAGFFGQMQSQEAQALGGIAEGVGGIAESAGKFASGDIAGGILAAVGAIGKLFDSLMMLDAGYQKWLSDMKETAEYQQKAAGGDAGLLKNPFKRALDDDLTSRDQLVKAGFWQRLWWGITGTAPKVLDDAAARALADAKSIFDQLGASLTSTFEASLLDAWSKGDLSNLQEAFEKDLDKTIAQMVIHEAAQIVLASDRIQELVKALGVAIKNRDTASITSIGNQLKSALTDGAAGIGEMLSGLPGFGAEGGLDELLNKKHQLEIDMKLNRDPLGYLSLYNDLTAIDTKIKDLQFKDLGKNIFSSFRDTWKSSLKEALDQGNFATFKNNFGQNVKKAIMSSIFDAVVAGVNLAGTVQPIIDRLVAAIRSGDKNARSKAIADLKGAIREVVATTKTLFTDLAGVQKELGIDTGDEQDTTMKGEVQWDTPQMRMSLDGMALLARTLETQIPTFEGSVSLFDTDTKLFDVGTKLFDTSSTRLSDMLDRAVPAFGSDVGQFGNHVASFGSHVDRFGNIIGSLPGQLSQANASASSTQGRSQNSSGTVYVLPGPRQPAWTPKK